MAVENIKSTPVTNLDSSPVVYNTQGEGAKFDLEHIDSFATAAAAASINSTYRFVRVPTTIKVKELIFESEAQGAGAIDIGVYYSSSTNDSPGALALAGVVVPGQQALFASAVAITAAVTPTNVVNESGSYTLDKRSLPLWQVAGLAADPGGFFDIVGTLTTAVTTGTGRMGVRVGFAK